MNRFFKALDGHPQLKPDWAKAKVEQNGKNLEWTLPLAQDESLKKVAAILPLREGKKPTSIGPIAAAEARIEFVTEQAKKIANGLGLNAAIYAAVKNEKKGPKTRMVIIHEAGKLQRKELETWIKEKTRKQETNTNQKEST